MQIGARVEYTRELLVAEGQVVLEAEDDFFEMREREEGLKELHEEPRGVNTKELSCAVKCVSVRGPMCRHIDARAVSSPSGAWEPNQMERLLRRGIERAVMKRAR